MTSGGARNRNRQPDPNSARSERRGFSLKALPAEGFDGQAPDFPLSPAVVMRKAWTDDGRAYETRDAKATTERRKREADLWRWIWTTPQACAWSMPSESWRVHTVAMWVRTFALCESAQATAADKTSLHRFADQIGLTPAGLKENGWTIAADQLAEKAAEKTSEPEERKPRERRLRAT